MYTYKKKLPKSSMSVYNFERRCLMPMSTASCDDEDCVADADGDAGALAVDKVNFVVAAAAVGSYLH